MAGRANLWKTSSKVGLMDPYGKQTSSFDMQFKQQAIDDDMLEFNSFDYAVDMALVRSNKIA